MSERRSEARDPPGRPSQRRGPAPSLAAEELQSVLDCIGIPVVLLDPDLSTKSVTRSAAKLLGVGRHDIGRSIAHVASPLVEALPEEELRQVVRSRDGLEREVETGHGRSYVLRALHYRSEGDGIEGIVLTFTDVTERRQKEQHRELLLAELGHRVKNTLTVVQSIAAQTMRRSTSVDAFYRQLSERLQALARAHALLSAGNWRRAQLREVIVEAFRPYEITPVRIRLEGEDCRLRAGAALALSLVIHELTTNATKHGALSTSSGSIEVRWHRINAGGRQALRLVWRETGGPRATAPAEHGFGLTVIERSVGHELDGTVRLDFAPEGLTCEMVIPYAPANFQV